MRHIFAILIGVMLIACGNPQQSESKKSRKLYDAKNLEEAVGFFYRIQASYEVIKTGEAIDFDYVVSCYNRDLPGSFHGVLWPQTMFKATKTGQAVAIAVPEYYCARGLRGEELIQDDDLWKMPHLSWYPDVNDLSFTFIYASNDAYTGPKAEVRFKSYKATSTTREAFYTWYKEEEQAYEQKGSIPGPFGCSHFNVSTREATTDCNHPDNRALNQGKRFKLPIEGLYRVRVLDWPKGYTEAAREYLGVKEARYRSVACIDPDTNENYKPNIGQYSNFNKGEHSPDKIRELAQKIRSLKMQSEAVYLDPERLLTGKGSRPIREVYPIIFHHRRPRLKEDIKPGEPSNINQIIRRPEWRGIAIGTIVIGDYLPEIPTPEYTGSHLTATFLNDTLVCERVGRTVPDIYDLELGQLLDSENNKPGITNW